MRRLFTKAVLLNLQRIVKGRIKVFFVDELLVVKITGESITPYCHTRVIRDTDIVYGLTAEMVATDIIKQYKSYIFDLYFY